jgi:uncharacterized protein (TIGR02266 family)
MSLQKSFSERRKTPRISTRTLVDYEGQNSFLYDYANNIGEGGMFIETDQPLRPGCKTILQFTLPEVDHVFRMEASVAWVHPLDPEEKSFLPEKLSGMGMKTLLIDENDLSILRKFVREKIS